MRLSEASDRYLATRTQEGYLLALMLFVITSTNMPVTGSAGYSRFQGPWAWRRISPRGWDSGLADG